MDKASKIRELLRSVTGTTKPTVVFRQMEVVSVDGDLCQAKIGDFELPNIRLAPIAGGSTNGLLITPAEGSIILVADISCGNLRELNAVGYSEIDSIRFHQGKTTVTADAEAVDVTVGGSRLYVEDGRVQLNDGSNGGLVKIEELTRSLGSLKSYCEALTTAVSAGLQAVGESTAASGSAGAGAFGGAMAATNIRIEQMENEKVKH